MQPAGSHASSSPESARTILAACGIAIEGLQPLAAGAQSTVWDVRARQGRFVLRVAAPRHGERVRYEAEYAIRKRLHALGGRVARPIATNRDVDAGVTVDWCLDEFAGSERPTGQLPRQACQDLGQTLALLHSLPVDGYGLLENRRDRLVGRHRDVRDGILSRLEQPWPFSGQPIERHPIATEAPDLLDAIEAMHSQLLGLLSLDRGLSVNHADLHAGQLPLSNGRLAAVLDFGDAVAGPPSWDIGSFGYFFGWNRTVRMLEGYSEYRSTRALLIDQGRMFAIVIALHHAGRSAPLIQPQRMSGALRYLRAALQGPCRSRGRLAGSTR
jgi:aminoglycoside phosphotransferase (APT) family kinase protein